MRIVQAQIARGRVAEMLAKGWAYVGPGEEDSVLMEGPEIGGTWVPLGAAVGRAIATVASGMVAPMAER